MTKVWGRSETVVGVDDNGDEGDVDDNGDEDVDFDYDDDDDDDDRDEDVDVDDGGDEDCEEVAEQEQLVTQG